MSISEKTIKLLWANAAGRCAFPDCGALLCTPESGSAAPYTIGEMAHIRGEKKGANRHDVSQTAKERDSYANLILLCYSFGVAEYVETTRQLGHLDAIIINSMWCGYTWDAKRTTRADKVGLYKIRDFMAALNKQNLWDYLNDSEKEKFAKEGWL
jgi:hypothetical protein